MAIKKTAPSVAVCTVIVVIALMSGSADYAYAGAQERYLVPVGTTVGIELKTDGVLVVGLTTPEGSAASPAGKAGILPGDLIIRLGDQKIASAADLLSAVREIDGGEITVTFRRGNVVRQYAVKPALSPEGDYKLGLWLRDGVSGIGTVTFYDPSTGLYGALGHAITDADTGVVIPMGRGEILDSVVIDVRKGVAGTPGELCGAFDVGKKRGNIVSNTDRGIFGFLNSGDAMRQLSSALPVAREAKPGAATILSNVKGREIGEYAVEISKVYKNDENGRSLMLTVTDPGLLEITGGIVQGMSGSPIIQDGKLVGAVTHVLVNDPTRGYGISVGSMLEAAQNGLRQDAA